jgi:hypothetical protein
MNRNYFLLLSFLIVSTAYGQTFETGFQTYGAYGGSDFDSINLANGNLILRIPVISYPQRGQLPDLKISVGYQQFGWYYSQVCDDEGNCQFNWLLNQPGGAVVDWLSEARASVSPYYGSCSPLLTVQDGTGAPHEMGYLGWDQTGNPFVLQAQDASGYKMQTATLYDGIYHCYRPDYTALWSITNKQGLVTTFSIGSQNTNYIVSDPSGNAITLETGSGPGGIAAPVFVDSLNRTIPLPL